LYITTIVVFLTAFSTRVSLLSSKIHNRDDTAKDSLGNNPEVLQCRIWSLIQNWPFICGVSSDSNSDLFEIRVISWKCV